MKPRRGAPFGGPALSSPLGGQAPGGDRPAACSGELTRQEKEEDQ